MFYCLNFVDATLTKSSDNHHSSHSYSVNEGTIENIMNNKFECDSINKQPIGWKQIPSTRNAMKRKQETIVPILVPIDIGLLFVLFSALVVLMACCKRQVYEQYKQP